MKKYIVAFLLSIVIIGSGFAQNKDSIKPQEVNLKISVENKADTTNSLVSKPGTTDCETCSAEKIKGLQWLLVFLPTLLFLLFFYFFMGWLKRDGFKIADALSSCEPLTLSQQTMDGGGNVTNETNTQVMPRSSSRLIAFLTGITAMTIGLCLTTYYIFITLADCPDRDLGDLWKIIASLGIGIIPYGANMWKESKDKADK